MRAEWIYIAGFVLIVDQASKQAILGRFADRRLPAGRRGPVIRFVANPRIGLGLFRTLYPLIMLWSVSVLGIALAMHALTFSHGDIVQIGAGVALGGATGNLLDLLRHGAVVDFIDLRIWPVFNLADLAILSGVITACFALLDT